jgi:hypothetical protein
MKDIKGYEGLYAITSCGKVWSYKSNRFLKPFMHQKGYCCVALYKDGQRKNFRIHRLVAEAYIPNPEDKPQVNHKDEVKTHNYINNLEWMTAEENNNYGTHNERSGNARRKPIYCVELEKEFGSITEAAQILLLSTGHISRCLKNPTCTTGGLHWRYVERSQAAC